MTGARNATIGRAWTLLSLNGANAGKVGLTYMGVVGNPTNWTNIVIAENESASPWKPFSVQKGYKPGDSVVSIFTGWGLISVKNSVYGVWAKQMDFTSQLTNIFRSQDPMFGVTVVLSPVVANYLKQEGHATMHELINTLYKRVNADRPHFRSPRSINILVTGGYNNLYYDYGGMFYEKSESIDKWR